MEVLISTFVIAVGLLGLAALFPIGRMTITETIRADRSADCGRAALHDVKVRRLLDKTGWIMSTGTPWIQADGSEAVSGGSVIIDPLGISRSSLAISSLPTPLQQVPHVTMKYLAATPALIEPIFLSQDDKIFNLPEEMRPPDPAGRPRPLIGSDNNVQSNGHYSWFTTVTRRPNTSQCTVSVVVCNQRDFSPPRTVTIPADPKNFLDLGVGGGSIVLPQPLTGSDPAGGSVRIVPNDWIALCGQDITATTNPLPTVCRWYRVVAIGEPANNGQQMLTLAGPDWDPNVPAVAVAIGKGVAGVYTTTMELDTDSFWNK